MFTKENRPKIEVNFLVLPGTKRFQCNFFQYLVQNLPQFK